MCLVNRDKSNANSKGSVELSELNKNELNKSELNWSKLNCGGLNCSNSNWTNSNWTDSNWCNSNWRNSNWTNSYRMSTMLNDGLRNLTKRSVIGVAKWGEENKGDQHCNLSYLDLSPLAPMRVYNNYATWHNNIHTCSRWGKTMQWEQPATKAYCWVRLLLILVVKLTLVSVRRWIPIHYFVDICI